jgi:hypothetical protein
MAAIQVLADDKQIGQLVIGDDFKLRSGVARLKRLLGDDVANVVSLQILCCYTKRTDDFGHFVYKGKVYRFAKVEEIKEKGKKGSL